MSSFITPVENLPIVFIAFLEKLSPKEMQAIFQTLKLAIERHGRLISILDVTCWEMTHEVVTYLAGAMAINEDGSPTDHQVVTLFVSNNKVTNVLEDYLADHRAKLGMVPCPSLDKAYDVALNIVKSWD